MRKLLPVALALSALIPVTAMSVGAAPARSIKNVTVPDEDRFAPFALTIHVGDAVKWRNNDTDDHTVVSDDHFTTAGHKGTDQLLATGATFTLKFTHPGTFLYYCRFHARLNEYNQPIAPGPDGGIQGSGGNFGTPMSGVITVLPSDN